MIEERSSSFLDIFWKLADIDAQVRYEAVCELISAEILSDKSSENYCYTVKRLTSGLGSSRGAARQGFSLALTTLLRKNSDVEACLDILEKLEQHTRTTGSTRRQEERDLYIGRLIGYLSFVRSGCIGANPVLAVRILKGTLALSKKKSWLKDISYEIICDVIDCTSQKNVVEYLLPHIREAYMCEGSEELTPYQLAVLITLWKRQGDEAIRKFQDLSILRDCFESTDFSSQLVSWRRLHKPLKAACKTNHLHPVWVRLVDALMKTPNVGLTFRNFWNSIVDDCLIRSTHEKRYSSMMLFCYICEILEKSEKVDLVASMLSSPFTKCIVNNSSLDTRYLHEASKAALSKLKEVLEPRENTTISPQRLEKLKIRVVSALITRGHRRFDQKTNTDTVATLLKGLSKQGILDYVQLLKSELINIDSSMNNMDTENLENEKKWVADGLYGVTKACADIEIRFEVSLSVAKFFFNTAFFSEKIDKTPFQSYCASRLVSTLSDMASIEFSSHKNQVRKDTGRSERPSICYQLLDHWLQTRKNMDMKKKWKPVFTEAEEYSFVQGVEVIHKLRNKNEKNDVDVAFELLLCHLLLQLLFQKFDNEHLDVDILEISEDVRACATKLCLSSHEADIEEGMQVLIDSMLAVLSQPSSLFRSVIKTVFVLVAELLTPISLGILVETLISEESLTAEKDETAVEEMEEDEEIDAVSSSKAEKKVIQSEIHSRIDREVEYHANSGIQDGLDKNKETTRLNINRTAIADASDDAEISDSEEESKNDEMDKYDRSIAEYFKHRMTEKRSKSIHVKVMREDIHFKHRVLDLLDVFCTLKAQNSMMLLIPCALIQASVKCLKSGRMGNQDTVGNEMKKLYERINNLQGKLYRAKTLTSLESLELKKNSLWAKSLLSFKSEFQTGGDKVGGEGNITLDQEEQICALIQSSLHYARKAGTPELGNLCVDAASYAIRVADKTSPFLLENNCVRELYKPVIQDCFGKRHSRIQPKLFYDMFERHSKYGWELLPDIVECVMNYCKTTFQKTEGTRIVILALKRVHSRTTLSKHATKLVDFFRHLVRYMKDRDEGGIIKAKRARVILQLGNQLSRSFSKFSLRIRVVDSETANTLREIADKLMNNAFFAQVDQLLQSEHDKPIIGSIKKHAKRKHNEISTIEPKEKKAKKKENLKKQKSHHQSKKIELNKTSIT